MVKNLPCNTGDSGLIPGQRTKVPHAAEQISPHTTTGESTWHNEDPTQLTNILFFKKRHTVEQKGEVQTEWCDQYINFCIKKQGVFFFFFRK